MKLFKLLLMAFLLMVPAYLVLSQSDNNTIELKEGNTLKFAAVVDEASVSSAIRELIKLDQIQTEEPIYLVLYTPGGSIEAGFDIMRIVKGMKRKVHTITIFAASMGFQMVQSMGDRYMAEYGTLMSHKPKGGFEGEFPGQVDSRYSYWMQRLLEMDLQTVKRTNGKQTLKSYRDAYENEMWLTPAKAIELGYADKLVNVRCDKSLDATYDETVNTMFGPIVATWSKCPLITTPVAVKLGGGKQPDEATKKKILEYFDAKLKNVKKDY
jgi:ATP-dependent Clp protease protease subunit